MKNNIDSNLLLKGAFCIAVYIFFIGPLMVKLGLKKGKTDRAIEQENSDNNSAFNANFWRSFYYSSGTAQNGRKPLTTTLFNRMKALAKTVYNCFSALGDNEAAFFSALKTCQTQADVSLLSQMLLTEYKVNLLELMKNGRGSLPNAGLSDSELQQAIDYVRNLPKS